MFRHSSMISLHPVYSLPGLLPDISLEEDDACTRIAVEAGCFYVDDIMVSRIIVLYLCAVLRH